MSKAAQAQVKAPPTIKSIALPTQSGLLQRKCACGGSPGVDGECAECRAKRLQRSETNPTAPSMVSPLVPHSAQLSISNAIPENVQTKLTVNQPGDKYEQEADQVTEQVMRMPEIKKRVEHHNISPVINEKAEETALHREEATLASKPSYTACFDGSTVYVNKGGKTQSCVALTDAGSGATPYGVYCIRHQGDAQISGGFIGLIFQNRSKWHLLEPQFKTTRFRMHLHPGSHSAGCVTVTDSKCFDKLASILNSGDTITAEGYDGYPPGNKAGKGGSEIVNAKRSVTCVGMLLVTSPGGCTSASKQTQPPSPSAAEPLQRSTANNSSTHIAPSIVHDVLHSSGEPLDTRTRSFIEPRLGHDFSQVRVHTDARAAESAHAVNALAYTVGRDVVFGTGQYAPNTTTGRRLLAHELTHVVQQRNGNTKSLYRAVDTNKDTERQFWLSLGYQPNYTVLAKEKRTHMLIQTGNQAANELLWTSEAKINRANLMRTFLKTKFGEDRDLRVTSVVKDGEHKQYRKMDVVPAGKTSWEELAAAAVHAGFWVHAEGVRLGGQDWRLSPKATGPHLDLYLIKRSMGDFPSSSDPNNKKTGVSALSDLDTSET